MAQAAPKLRVRSTSQIVIPARLASTRLPRKLLLRETGRSLIQHTYEAARRRGRRAFAWPPIMPRFSTKSARSAATWR